MKPPIRVRALSRAHRATVAVLAALASTALTATTASAQVMRDSSTSWLLSAGGEAERYLRALDDAGAAPPTSWLIRPFSGRLTRELVAGAAAARGNPWAAQMTVPPRQRAWLRVIEPEAGAIFNSRFPYGQNDGPLWAGRGLTGSLLGGIEAGFGPLEVRIAPQVFRAQNGTFALAPNGATGLQAFGDQLNSSGIDLPQRFGDGAYQRVDAGQSVIQLRGLGFAAGVSTANEVWGPAVESPYLLGVNAAGFPHAFIGTDGPLYIGPVHASVRIIGGRLDQSPYAPITDTPRRYLSGVIAAIGVRYLPGLEVGGARLFHNALPDTGVTLGDLLSPLLLSPFKAQLTAELGNQGYQPDNQLASVFFRWSPPRSGFEVYGEMGREDNAFDMRDYLVEPDRDMSYSLGFQRVWTRPDGSLFALRGEVLNSSPSHLGLLRPPAPLYIHAPLRQGHTQIGQVLGAPGGYGGGAGMLAVEWLTSTGRRTITWRRTLREPTAPLVPKDVVQALTVDWLVFGRRVDLAPEATLAYNFNRDGGDGALNVRTGLTARMHW